MGKHLQFDLADLESALTRQAGLVEEMVRTASRGLHERRVGVPAELQSMEAAVNRCEVLLEEQCLHLLAIHQPVAIDLRRIASALKINSDLERIADLAVNLAERNESIVGYPKVTIPGKLEEMVALALRMLCDARRAFVDLDANLALAVCRDDEVVDGLNREVITALVRQMKDDAPNVPAYLHLYSASRIVERIGDHATNIAEDVVYMVNGAISRRNGSRSA